MNAHVLIGQSAMVYCAGKNRASSELLYKSNRPQVSMVYLTNRFHVAVRLFSNRSQMTSKCGKNKKVAHEA